MNINLSINKVIFSKILRILSCIPMSSILYGYVNAKNIFRKTKFNLAYWSNIVHMNSFWKRGAHSFSRCLYMFRNEYLMWRVTQHSGNYFPSRLCDPLSAVWYFYISGHPALKFASDNHPILLAVNQTRKNVFTLRNKYFFRLLHT